MKKLNPKDAPYYAAIAQTLQYGHVGFVYLGIPGLVTAGALGALMSFAVALASSRINDIAKGRKLSSWILFVVLLIISPAFVGVGMWVALEIIPVPFWRIVVSALWGLIPDGSIALVGFVTGKGLVADEKPKNNTATRTKPNKSSRSLAMSKQVSCPYCHTKMSQGKLNAHKGGCLERPGNKFAESLQEASKR